MLQPAILLLLQGQGLMLAPTEALKAIQYLQEVVLKADHPHLVLIITLLQAADHRHTAEGHLIIVPVVHLHPDHIP